MSCCSSSCSTKTCTSSCTSADVTLTEYQTQVIDPNNPQIIITSTTCTNFDDCSSSSKSCSTSSSCTDRKKDRCKDKCKSYIFRAIITNSTGLVPSLVEFTMRRANNTVTIQWKEFSAVVSANGIAYVSAAQSLPSLPRQKVNGTIGLLFNGRGQVGLAEVSPDFDQIKFYFNLDKSGAEVLQGDSYMIYPGTLTWII